jgi:TorA maturation chaperone TorD
MTLDDFTASAEDRSRFFWWLAEWFLSPPNADQLASLVNPDMAQPPLDAMDSAWLALSNAAPDLAMTSLDEIGAEFTRLFSGISEGKGPPPPFESVWREDRLIGESTVAVLEAYTRAGFSDIDPDAGPQDHVSVELKFIAMLALREAEAWRADDSTGAHQRLLQQRDFLRVHLSTWAPRWADAVMQQTNLPLFAALAGLLKATQELTELTQQAD